MLYLRGDVRWDHSGENSAWEKIPFICLVMWIFPFSHGTFLCHLQLVHYKCWILQGKISHPRLEGWAFVQKDRHYALCPNGWFHVQKEWYGVFDVAFIGGLVKWLNKQSSGEMWRHCHDPTFSTMISRNSMLTRCQIRKLANFPLTAEARWLTARSPAMEMILPYHIAIGLHGMVIILDAITQRRVHSVYAPSQWERHNNVTPSLIGWAYTQNDPWQRVFNPYGKHMVTPCYGNLSHITAL